MKYEIVGEYWEADIGEEKKAALRFTIRLGLLLTVIGAFFAAVVSLMQYSVWRDGFVIASGLLIMIGILCIGYGILSLYPIFPEWYFERDW